MHPEIFWTNDPTNPEPTLRITQSEKGLVFDTSPGVVINKEAVENLIEFLKDWAKA